MIELLVVLGTFAVLGMMLLPALASTRTNSQALQCMHNTRELTRGWLMYASDYQDALMKNTDWAGSSIMSWYSSTSVTNTALLLNGSMGSYIKSASLFKCPADKYVSPQNLGPRARSISLNGVLTGPRGGSGPVVRGTNPDGRLYYGSGKTCGKMSDLAVPGPANVYVFLDEHPDSINDGSFYFDVGAAPGAQYWRDLPASYHNEGCGISFADGRSEIHSWLEQDQTGPYASRKTVYPVTYGAFGTANCPGSRDYQWMQDRMPYRRTN